MEQLATPVVFLIFNRPEKTTEVFKRIREVRPRKLFVIADAPRFDEERAKCDAARTITEQVDWPCEVYRNYAHTNMGVKHRPPDGISWVFKHVDRAIILEDDCVPHPDFFRFCQELLEYYKDDERVMQISGDNFEPAGMFAHEASYWFSPIPYLWGWATWRRAWEKYDPDMQHWQAFKKEKLAEVLPDPVVLDRWSYVLNRYKNGSINSWDGPWVAACLEHGICINPSTNLVTNIGHDREASHPKSHSNWRARLPTHPMPWPLVHPQTITVHEAAEAFSQKYVFSINVSLRNRFVWHFKSLFPTTYRLCRTVYRTWCSYFKAAT